MPRCGRAGCNLTAQLDIHKTSTGDAGAAFLAKALAANRTLTKVCWRAILLCAIG